MKSFYKDKSSTRTRVQEGSVWVIRAIYLTREASGFLAYESTLASELLP